MDDIMNPITIVAAKKITKKFLEENNLQYTKLTGKTVDFTDLARVRIIFVKVHGWKPDPQWAELKQLAIDNGFRVEA